MLSCRLCEEHGHSTELQNQWHSPPGRWFISSGLSGTGSNKTTCLHQQNWPKQIKTVICAALLLYWKILVEVGTVDGRNPAPPNPVNNGINYQPQLVSRISEPPTVCSYQILGCTSSSSTSLQESQPSEQCPRSSHPNCASPVKSRQIKPPKTTCWTSVVVILLSQFGSWNESLNFFFPIKYESPKV